VGLEKATTAAKAVGGVVLSPAFAPADRGTDWNDYVVQHGREALRAAAQASLRVHGIELPSASRSASAHPAAAPRAAAADRMAAHPSAPTQADRDAARQRLPGGGPGAGAAEAAAREAARQAQRERAPRATP